MTMRWMTFSDWRENGYRIRAGVKSTKRDGGKATPATMKTLNRVADQLGRISNIFNL